MKATEVHKVCRSPSYYVLVYSRKVTDLLRNFARFRPVRPDGNCFYRAYLFGALEQCLTSSDPVGSLTALRARFGDLAVECKSYGYDAFALDDFHELLDEQIASLLLTPTIQYLESSVFSDPSVDGYFVAFMRSCCGAYIRKFSVELQPFIPAEYATIDAFIRNEVDPMYKDCDQIQIVALSRALDVPLKIVYMDQSPGVPSVHSFGPEGSRVTLLYKPGHYDLLYWSTELSLYGIQKNITRRMCD